MRSTLLILLVLMASPWAQAELIDEVNDRGELRIAVQADSPPFSFKEHERLTGFAIELGQVLAAELDVRAEFIETPAEQVLPGVESGKYDIALDQVNAREQLDGRVEVSQPYQAGQDGKPSLVIPFQKGNPAFRSAVDNALQRIKDDGRLTVLQQKWLEKKDDAPAQP